MPNYDTRAELAPRDIVARAIEVEIQKSAYDYVWLDCSTISNEKLKKRFPAIYETCHSIGIQLPEDPIPVVPAAHYICGGIQVNHHGESQLNGLYAIGECSCTGLHGANRLASNSLLESVVFSHRAALHATQALKKLMLNTHFFQSIPDWQGEKKIDETHFEALPKLRKDLQYIMTQKVGIFKTNAGLHQAEINLNHIYKTVTKIYNNNKLTTAICELRNMVSIAYLIIKQSQKIKRNKGVFYNEDNEN